MKRSRASLPIAAAAAAAIGFALASAPAFAVPSDATVTAAGGKFYQQQETSPCIISGVNCNNGTFPLEQYSNAGNLTAIEAWSPVYSYDFLFKALQNSNSFIVGLDVQDTKNAQFLKAFDMYESDSSNGTKGEQLTDNKGDVSGTAGTLSTLATKVSECTTACAGSGKNVIADTNKGAGFADYLIGNLAKIAPNKFYQFHSILDPSNDGPDQFFLISDKTPAQIPVPAALPLLLTAFAGLGFFGWRRRERVA